MGEHLKIYDCFHAWVKCPGGNLSPPSGESEQTSLAKSIPEYLRVYLATQVLVLVSSPL